MCFGRVGGRGGRIRLDRLLVMVLAGRYYSAATPLCVNEHTIWFGRLAANHRPKLVLCREVFGV